MNAVSQASLPRVSIIVPARNEGLHIRACLDSLLSQSVPAEQYEVIVVDGNSADDTGTIVRHLQHDRSNLRLIENPKRVTPVGMNLGIRSARGDVIIIAGAHSIYPEDMVAKSLEYLERTGAAVVGGPVNTVCSEHHLSARLTSVILSSPFGVGHSFRTMVREGFVDTVPFGAYRREVLERVGLYNERLLRNQDNDLSSRIRQSGGRIYLTPELAVQYHSVASIGKLLRKTFSDSQWHAFTVRENPRSMAIRHFVPLAMLISSLFLVMASFFVRPALWILVILLGLHFGLGFFFGLARKKDLGLVGMVLFPAACLTFHFVYGAGTLAGLFKIAHQERVSSSDLSTNSHPSDGRG